MHAERVDPEVVGALGVTGGDVTGRCPRRTRAGPNRRNAAARCCLRWVRSSSGDANASGGCAGAGCSWRECRTRSVDRAVGPLLALAFTPRPPPLRTSATRRSARKASTRLLLAGPACTAFTVQCSDGGGPWRSTYQPRRHRASATAKTSSASGRRRRRPGASRRARPAAPARRGPDGSAASCSVALGPAP